jgi:hypothetical protein
MADAILVIIIIVILFWFYNKKSKKNQDDEEKKEVVLIEEVGEEPLPTNGQTTTETRPEDQVMNENTEFNSETVGENTVMEEMSSAHGDHVIGKTEYFGNMGMEYKDYVANMAIDPSVKRNHADFVKDRIKTTQNITGKTYSPDFHDSYDPVPWQGIRGRPQGVPFNNPDQVPDIDRGLFSKRPQMTWSSS